jgi:hypothetical protein
MHECVEEAEEGAVPAWGEFDSEPDGHWHDAMMDDVERADLIILFSQNEKKSVDEFRKLRKKIPPRSVHHLQLMRFSDSLEYLVCQLTLSVLGLFE